MARLARLLEWFGNRCLDLALKLELRASGLPHAAPPITEITHASFIATSGERVNLLPPDIEPHR